MERNKKLEVKDGTKLDDRALEGVVGGLNLPVMAAPTEAIRLNMISPVKKPIAHK